MLLSWPLLLWESLGAQAILFQHCTGLAVQYTLKISSKLNNGCRHHTVTMWLLFSNSMHNNTCSLQHFSTATKESQAKLGQKPIHFIKLKSYYMVHLESPFSNTEGRLYAQTSCTSTMFKWQSFPICMQKLFLLVLERS